MKAENDPADVAKMRENLGLTGAHNENSGAPEQLGLIPVALDNLMNTESVPIRFVVHPICPARMVTLLGGHGGIGKSAFSLAIAAHVACGQEFAGFSVERCPALYVSLEDEPAIVIARLRRIIEAYQLPADEVLENLRILDGTECDSALFTETTYPTHSAMPIFTHTFKELAAHAEGVGIIVIDNASDAYNASENCRRSVRAFIRGLTMLARKKDAAVVLLAHIDKSAAKFGSNGNAYSGSTAWHNSARSRLALVEEDNALYLKHEKANFTQRAEPVPIEFCNGLPMPAIQQRQADVTQETIDRTIIVQCMQAAAKAGITVHGSLTPAAHCAMKSLEPLLEYSRAFDGRGGAKRASRALMSLLQIGRIRIVEYRKGNRHPTTQLELVEAAPGAASMDPEKCAASPPYNPPAVDAAHGSACVDPS